MKALILMLSLALVPASAQAIQRYNIGGMSCVQVHTALRRDKAAILRHRSPRTGMTLYDRYVQDGRFCPSYHVPVYDYLPTADTPSCPIYHCVPDAEAPGIIGFGD